MINCNPETVSTDYDTTDRLYFEPLTFEDVMTVIDERDGGGEVACLVQFGGQTPLKLALALQAPASRSSAPRPTRSTWRRIAAIRAAAVGPRHPAAGERHGHLAPRRARSPRNRLPGRRAAVLRARRPRRWRSCTTGDARSLHDAGAVDASPSIRCSSTSSSRTRSSSTSTPSPTRRRGGHRRHHGAHRGGGHPLGRQLVRRAAVHGRRRAPGDDS